MGPPRTAAGGQVGAVAQTTLLSAADCDFIKEMQHSLSAEAANGRGCGGLLTAILDHLDHFKEQIHAVNVWGPVVAEAHTSRGKSQVTITGPGPEDRFCVPASGPEDALDTVSLWITPKWLPHSEWHSLTAGFTGRICCWSGRCCKWLPPKPTFE